MTGSTGEKMPRIIICPDCDEKKEHKAKGRCHNCYSRYYYQKHRETRLEYARHYRLKYPEKARTARQQSYQKNRHHYLSKSRQWARENPEETREIKRRWAEENPGYQRQHYLAHRDEYLIRASEWAEQNPKQYATNQKRWREQNPERRKGIEARRQARKRNLPDTLTEDQRKQLLVVGQATHPGEDLHLDHIVPLKHGGGTTLANMHYIPAGVNVFKKDRLPQEIYEQLELCR